MLSSRKNATDSSYDINESEHLLHASYVLITALSLLHLLSHFMWYVLILSPFYQ